ncbi:FecR family protein [Chitinophaga defluvii]|uniref:FecR domain-containing protein n=1 Tax=Chitinophaga defluvii TaxID=3163343 RepID=A0ABV2T4Q7_9BACT
MADASFRSWVKNNDATAAAFWESWIERNPEKLHMVEEARGLLEMMDFNPGGPTEEEMKEVKGNIDRILLQIKTEYIAPERPVRRIKKAYYWAAAASILILLTAGWFHYIYNAPVKVSTGYAQTKQVTLPDNSKLILNANSTITYSKNWSNSSAREVWLDGEAFFEVAKAPHSAAPKFSVHAGTINVDVLGTSFNVYHRKGNIAVVLEEGKVALENNTNHQREIMQPGQMMTWDTHTFNRQPVNTALYTSWKDKRLVFENKPLSEIARMLEDNYGYRVAFKKKELETLRFTGACSTEDINILLANIKEVFELEIIRKDTTIIFQ